MVCRVMLRRLPVRLAALAYLVLAAPALPVCAADPKEQRLTVGLRNNMEATLYTPDGPGPREPPPVVRPVCERLSIRGLLMI